MSPSLDYGSKDPQSTDSAADAPSPSGEQQSENEEGSDEADSPTAEPGEVAEDVAPPLPDEDAPPLPNEEPPDDGWEPVWDATAQAYYFYNRLTKATQWENPRVPEDSNPSVAAGLGPHDRMAGESSSSTKTKSASGGGYNPAIHGDYDPNADYAQEARDEDEDASAAARSIADATAMYAATGAFNRFTGRWQDSSVTPENHTDENKSNRQMNAYFDVDAAANSHDGRSLKAERQGKKLSRQEVKAFKEKRREKKEEKRRAWLRD